ncbi:hypothetical protein IWQ60_009013 [Tieghemiomyces parasiticus]|uniref:Uncharacterized protein n=1 Tax=Tieghemiomyces parasiticus TaxID=78921 RepID=A0A9W8DLW6_9FUNG|nr:hypothetical protein IWQ60_009013 [Tieghemiomyces parasiticus]
MRLSLSFVLALALATGPLATLALPAKKGTPAVKTHLNPGKTVQQRKVDLTTASSKKPAESAGSKNPGKLNTSGQKKETANSAGVKPTSSTSQKTEVMPGTYPKKR